MTVIPLTSAGVDGFWPRSLSLVSPLLTLFPARVHRLCLFASDEGWRFTAVVINDGPKDMNHAPCLLAGVSPGFHKWTCRMWFKIHLSAVFLHHEVLGFRENRNRLVLLYIGVIN